MARSFIVLTLDGVADGPFGVTLDVIAAASRAVQHGLLEVPVPAPFAKTRVVSLDGQPVRTSARRRLEVDSAISPRSLHPGDVVVLPGLGMATPAEIDAALARDDVRRVCGLLARAAAKGVIVAASCSATFVLGAAGVLDGIEATTTWWLGREFEQRFPRVTLRDERMVVESGCVFTAGSAFAHADLMLALIARTYSPSLAHTVAKYLVLDERASQSRYMALDHARSVDPTVRALERFISRNLARQLSLPQMARATATSPRTLARKLDQALGTTPLRFAQRMRMAHALHLLETTQRSVDAIAAAVGYADAAAFRRIFRREIGEAPRTRRPR